MDTPDKKKPYQGPTADRPYFDPKHFEFKAYVERAVSGLQPGHHKDVKSGEHGPVQAWLWNIEDVNANGCVTLSILRNAFSAASLAKLPHRKRPVVTLAELFQQHGPVIGIVINYKTPPYAALTLPGYNRSGD